MSEPSPEGTDHVFAVGIEPEEDSESSRPLDYEPVEEVLNE